MKKLTLWVTYNVIFVLPVVLYVLINFYWWLFGENDLNVDKMIIAVGWTLSAGVVSAAWANLGEVFKK